MTIKDWGGYDVLCKENGYQVKRLVVNPGWLMSIQRHLHRREHWVVVSGIGKVYTGYFPDELYHRFIRINDSIDIPAESWHSIGNPGRIPLVLIEVQTGEYLEEDDIERKTKSENVGVEKV